MRPTELNFHTCVACAPPPQHTVLDRVSMIKGLVRTGKFKSDQKSLRQVRVSMHAHTPSQFSLINAPCALPLHLSACWRLSVTTTTTAGIYSSHNRLCLCDPYSTATFIHKCTNASSQYALKYSASAPPPLLRIIPHGSRSTGCQTATLWTATTVAKPSRRFEDGITVACAVKSFAGNARRR